MPVISLMASNRYKEYMLLRRRALIEAKKMAQILGKKFGAQKVVLYGSLIQKDKHFDKASDIDLAVKGLSRHYFAAYGYCLRLAKFNLDIKAYEDMPQYWLARIEEGGRLLYEKKYA